MSDSNALLPPDYIERLLERWRDDIGVVSTATIVTRPEGFSAELECAFMNSFQARMVLAADIIGYGFALGKTLMWRKSVLERLGGLPALASEAAEDIASTKILRGTPLRPRLARRPIEQPIGRRSFASMWSRQLRWAKLRRAGLLATYLPEFLSGGFFPLLVAAALAVSGLFAWPAALAYAVAWYGLEAVVCLAGGWPLRFSSPLAWLVRDALVPVLWIGGWAGNSFEWRGNVMTVKRARGTPAEPTEA
jgi:ceramide glucosyltransferase